jgi:hypothetical protein
MEPTKLQNHIRLTYFSLRVGLGALALIFPVLLVAYGWYVENIPIRDSMSAYYFAFVPEDSDLRVFPMRGFFVGILWAIGCFLILYRGFSITENWLLNLAGFCAIGVAFFPMKAACKYCASVDLSVWHNRFAFALFVFIACVAWFCNGDSLRELAKEQTQRQRGRFEPRPETFRRIYFVLGVLMILAPAGSYLVGIYAWRTLAVEWAGIWVFAIYWLVKSYELYLSKADEKAARGEMTVTEPAADAYRQVMAKLGK